MADATDVLDGLFSERHKAVREIGHGMYDHGHAIAFPTAKACKGAIRARSPLMADGLLHLDTDPNVLAISPYPMEIAYWSTFDGVRPAKRDHIPDIAIRLRNGETVFIDYVPLMAQRQSRYFRVRVAERVRHFRNEYGASYAVHDERSVRIQPRLSNLRLMAAHGSRKTDPASLGRAKAIILQAQFPTSIRSISDLGSMSRQAVRWSDLEEPVLVEENNLIFTAVLQLAMSGDVRLDLGKPLTLDSIVYGGDK